MNTTETLTLDERRELCAATVTLNGEPAAIRGAQCDYGTVGTMPNGPAHEWAWPTIARIVARDGAFQS